MARFLFPCTLFLSLAAWSFVEGGSLKRGVALKSDDLLCGDLEVLNTIGWWHDWRCNLDYYYENNICPDIMHKYACSHAPMVWGYYANTNHSCPSESVVTLQGPNEPNRVAQSNLTPQQAADGWRLMEANNPNKILVSPSASKCSGSTCNYGNTTVWFDEFFRLCNDCRIDYLATHTYWCGVDKTMDYLESLYNRYNRPIWLTEFACRHDNNNADRVLTFMQGLLPRLEAAPFIARYAWYKLRVLPNSGWVETSASLMEANSSTLTAIGQFYRDYVYIPDPPV